MLNDRLANDVRRNGTHSSETDDDRVLRALVRNEMCEIRYCGDDQCDARVPDLRLPSQFWSITPVYLFQIIVLGDRSRCTWQWVRVEPGISQSRIRRWLSTHALPALFPALRSRSSVSVSVTVSAKTVSVLPFRNAVP